jgi:membrane-bound serine protease (ClpP class)
MRKILPLFFLPLTVFAQNIKVISIQDHIIGPVTANYIQRGLEIAEKEEAILIIQLDTPGGLLKSTQEIVKLLLNSPIPVVTYITPRGAKAASAGVFISYASHLLAMSPSTHLGSAHPIIGGGSWGKLPQEVKEKVLNDTLAWAENIASQRNRPVSFIRDAIKKSKSITEKEALRLKVCDLVAQDLEDLVKKIDGKVIKIEDKRSTLSTKKAQMAFINLSPQERFLNTIIEPNIAYLLLTLGFLGLVFEVTHPGFGFPGVAGLISLILSFYALSILPVNYAGIAFIVLGIIFFIVEAFTPTFGMFTLGGIISLFLGSVMMFNQPQLIKVSYKFFLPVIAFFSLLSLFLLGKVIASQREKPKTGPESLLGRVGRALTDIEKEGKVLIHSEVWDAVASEIIKKDDEIIVEKIDGLKLYVKRKEG